MMEFFGSLDQIANNTCAKTLSRSGLEQLLVEVDALGQAAVVSVVEV
jgi:hypothetical protein